MAEKPKINDIIPNSDSIECFKFIESILAYKLSVKEKQPFLFFHDFITNPEPDFLKNWKSDPKKNNWHEKFSNRILGDLQNAYPCVLYHSNKLIELENSIISGIEKYNFRNSIPKNSSIAGGNTLIFDFEYQAYILAFRRCLDYLARAIGTYFMNDFVSFRKLGENLQKLNRPIATNQLIETHKKYTKNFQFIISEGNDKSVRDIISHYEFVSAGTFNLSKRGMIIAGGGKKEFVLYGEKNMLFSEVIQNQVSDLRLCIREFIYIYVNSIKIEQNLKKKNQ